MTFLSLYLLSLVFWCRRFKEPCKTFLDSCLQGWAAILARVSIHTTMLRYFPFHELSSILAQVLQGQSTDFAVISAVGVLKRTVRTHTSTGSPPAVASSTCGCGNLVEQFGWYVLVLV